MLEMQLKQSLPGYTGTGRGPSSAGTVLKSARRKRKGKRKSKRKMKER